MASDVRRSVSRALAATLALGLSAGCEPDPGEATTAEGIFAPMGEPIPAASAEQVATFERGRAVSLRRFTPEEGLGPRFNVTFCGACHEKPTPGGSSPRYRDFHLVQQALPDGSVVPLGMDGVLAQFLLDGRPTREPTPEGTNHVVTRSAIPFFGVGLLAEIPEEEILRHADPDDDDGDGVSGRPNWDRGFVGRFGRKAQTVSIEGFIRGPLNNHLGITSDPLPNLLKARLPVPSDVDLSDLQTLAGGLGTKVGAQAAAPSEPLEDSDDVPDPELSQDDLFDLVSFAMLLAAPEPEPPTAETRAGRDLFDEIGCATCHVPALEGPRGLVPAYTDLLLHDMGEALADGVEQGVATGAEFRTQPLWGVTAVGPWLHDGRADTLDEAIRLHGGEGEGSRDAYEALSADDRARVVAFLESLGGRTQASEGLIPPDGPAPVAGEYGGPVRPLSEEEAARFERGRRVFDRDVPRSEGLGPGFNGDACRSCHTDPVVGGAGPLGVSVTRQGILDEATGAFATPAGGTMAHHHSADLYARATVDPLSNFFEVRQTPSTLGLGLIDRIPGDVILAGEDPDDADGDGVRGVAHVLPDGRVGRLGWKANVPSVEEFLRDAMSNELGVTLPTREGQRFGFLEDADAAPDPELSDADYDAILFFMATLAPPPPLPVDPAVEAVGEEIFHEIGCATCHVPELPTGDGTPVPLYSDLLLHDVLPEGAWGIEDGQAGQRAFRTPPLWGCRDTAPYMHDGAASTMGDAILDHHGEAAASRDAYQALDGADREALLAFLRSL